MNFNSNSKSILINTIEGINVIQVRDGIMVRGLQVYAAYEKPAYRTCTTLCIFKSKKTVQIFILLKIL